MSELTFNVPINQTSFGQVSVALLREMYDREMSPLLFPIGGDINLSTHKEDKGFHDWLIEASKKAFEKHHRNNKTLKLWHINGALESFSNDQLLMTFYELDNITPSERNALLNNRVAVTSSYTKEIFESVGLTADFVPLAFDKYNFYRTDKKYFEDDRITFNLCGKFEHRKHHVNILRAWAKQFGNNTKYHLQCSLYNNFLSPEQNNEIIAKALNGIRYSNIIFLNFMSENSKYNEFLNSADIVLGMSGGEGWGLPEFQSVCLGKHAVVLNAHAYKDWATDETCVMVEPSGKIPSADGVFFREGSPFNQGEFYTWEEQDFVNGCYDAIKRVKDTQRVNSKGIELQKEFTYSKTLDKILELM